MHLFPALYIIYENVKSCYKNTIIFKFKERCRVNHYLSYLEIVKTLFLVKMQKTTSLENKYGPFCSYNNEKNCLNLWVKENTHSHI